MKLHRTLTAAALSLALFSAVQAATLTLYVNSEQEPKAWVDGSGKARGFAVETAEAVLKDAGIDFVVKGLPFPRALGEVKDCKGVMAGVFHTEERARLYAFSAPIVPDKFVVVTRSDDPLEVGKLDDLTGRTISYLRGADVFGLQARFPADKLDSQTSPLVMIKKLADKRTQAVILNPGSRAVEVAARNAEVPMAQLKIAKASIASLQNHIVACKEDPLAQAALKKIDASIARLKGNGAFEAVMKNYGGL